MKVNWFMMALGVQYLAAAIFEAKRKSWSMFVVYLCYGISAIALGTVEIK